MSKRSTFSPDRVEILGPDKTKFRRADKNFDDIFSISNSLENRISKIEKQLGILGPMSLSTVVNIALSVGDADQEFALMVGLE